MLYKVWLLVFKWKSLSKTFIWYFCIAPMMLFMLFLQCVNVWIGEKILHFVTIQMKAAEQIFAVVLVVMLYLQGGSNFWVCGKKSCSVAIHMKAVEQIFPVVLIIMFKLLGLWMRSLNMCTFKWKLLWSFFLQCGSLTFTSLYRWLCRDYSNISLATDY